MPGEREVRYVLKRLANEGWKKKSVRGSHVKLYKNDKIIVVSVSKREIPLGTYRTIARQAGWL